MPAGDDLQRAGRASVLIQDTARDKRFRNPIASAASAAGAAAALVLGPKADRNDAVNRVVAWAVTPSTTPHIEKGRRRAVYLEALVRQPIANGEGSPRASTRP